MVSEYFSKMFPSSTDIKDECAISSYYINNHEKAFDIHEDCLTMKGLTQDRAWRLLFNQHFSINHVADRYIFYNKEKIDGILKRTQKDFPLVTLTITTCKRFDLFEKTMNSIINCVDIDEIDFWFCVDDNSSDEDRQKMKDLYPFFEFYFKDKIYNINVLKESMEQLEMKNLSNGYSASVAADSKGRRVLHNRKEVGLLNFELSNVATTTHYFAAVKDVIVAGEHFQSGLSVYNLQHLKWEFIKAEEIASLVGWINN
jgi:hypothetical protein